MKLTRVGVVGLFVLVVACAAPQPLFTPQALEQARAEGRLEALYDEVVAVINAPDTSSSEREYRESERRRIGQWLAEDRVSAIETLLVPVESVGVVPLAAILEAEKLATPLSDWSPEQAAAMKARLSALRRDTQAAIDERLERLNRSAEDDVAERLTLYDELIALNGGEGARVFEQQKWDYLDDAYMRGAMAVENKQFMEAQRLLTPVANEDPDYKGIQDLLLQVNGGLFEQRFWDALGSGQPEEAYNLFVELAESPGFGVVRDQVTSAANDLGDYFLALGEKDLKKGQYTTALQSFRHARYIREKLDKPYASEERAFLKKVDSFYQQARKDEALPLALGYLMILEDLDPTWSSVKRDMRTLREKILSMASVKIAAMPMSNASQERAFGRGMASKVSQQLLEAIPNDVYIIEREQFDSIIKKTERPDSSTYLSYYYVQGEIQESAVETSEETQTRKVRVVTDYEEEPNPAYEEWQKRSRDTEAPPKVLRTPIKEDVTLRATRIEKVGVFSVIFRLVDPFSAKVLFVDSVTEKAEHVGENIEGMELGEFHQESQVADLPSDSEILQKLADQIARQVGERLIEELKDPELKYRDYALRAINEEKIEAAARNFVMATVLTERKGNDASQLRKDLYFNVMRVAAE